MTTLCLQTPLPWEPPRPPFPVLPMSTGTALLETWLTSPKPIFPGRALPPPSGPHSFLPPPAPRPQSGHLRSNPSTVGAVRPTLPRISSVPSKNLSLPCPRPCYPRSLLALTNLGFRVERAIVLDSPGGSQSSCGSSVSALVS